MLKEIKLKNFKLHRDTKLNFGKITLFIGPNNSGKSSAIHAMQVIRKYLGESNIPHKSNESGHMLNRFIDIENFDDIVNFRENRAEIGIKGRIDIDFTPTEKEFLKKNPIIDPKSLEVEGVYSFEEYKYTGKIVDISSLEKIGIRIRGCTKKRGSKDEYEISMKKLGGKGRCYQFTSENNYKIAFIYHPNRKIDLSFESVSDSNGGGIGKKIRHSGGSHTKPSENEYRIISSIFEKIISSLERLIESFHFVYPIRGLEWQSYDTEPNKTSANLNLDNISIDKRAKGIANTFIYDRLLEDEIYEKIKGVVDVRFFAELSTGNKVKLLSKISKRENIPFLFEGLGSHQMLFMLLPIALANSNETIFIEEPETHLHPKAQYALSKLFAEIAGKQEKQLVMTTHSEHIVFGFLNMVAKEQLKKDDLKIYYFENKNGIAKVKELKVNEFGQVDGGLPGFFEAEVEGLLEFLGEPEEKGK